jgi:hypothetical protein
VCVGKMQIFSFFGSIVRTCVSAVAELTNPLWKCTHISMHVTAAISQFHGADNIEKSCSFASHCLCAIEQAS